MGFFSFLVLVVIAYCVWRISEQLPDVLFRLGEIQKDIAELNRRGASATEQAPKTKAETTRKKPASKEST
jgi:hypothetical protein